MPLTITYNLEPADMKAFYAWNRRRGPAMKRARYRALVVAVLVATLATFTRSPRPDHLWILFIVNLVIMVFCTFFFGGLFLRIAQWLRLRNKNPSGLYCEHTITLEDDALVETTSVNVTRHPWAEVRSVVDAPTHILLYVIVDTAKTAAHVIPKHAFPTLDAIHEFYQRALKLCNNAKTATGA